MRRILNARFVGMIGTVVLLRLPTVARACSVCSGQADNTTQVDEAMNGAIFFMLGVLGVMMSLIAAVCISLARRAQHPVPAHIELAEFLGTSASAK